MKATYHSEGVKRMAVCVSVLIASCVGAFAQDSLQQYTQANLVSSQAGVAQVLDSDLVNAWGLSRSSSSPWWVSNDGTGKVTLYAGLGGKETLVVTVPTGNPSVSPTGTPTGTISNECNTAFLLAPGRPAVAMFGTQDERISGAPAAFIFVTQDGTISGWNPDVQNTQAVIEVNENGKSVFTGATIAQVTEGGISTTYLYVADFRKGRVQVYDTSFHEVSWGDERFIEGELPEGYAPFNIQNINGYLYVAYAKQDAEMNDAIAGPGFGEVAIFSPSGRLLQRLEQGPWFNAPWGLVLASSGFGAFSHDVLVGQFGSGEILAFNPGTGHFEGKLLNTSNQPITIEGLRALAFGNGGTSGPETTLYFTAATGLFGTLTAVQ